MNYVTRTYTLAVNGVAAGGPLALLNEADAGIGDIDFLALTRGTDTGYFNNFSISTSIVPEPAWIAAIPALAAWVMRRRHGTKVSQVGLPSTLRKPSGEPGNSRMGQYWSSN